MLRSVFCLLTSALVLAGLAGCSAFHKPVAVAASPTVPERAEADFESGGAPPPAADEAAARPGDGFDTRLITNVTQHTFSTIGRDFDPDLSPDGQTLAYASTYHSEAPDIFMKDVNGFAITQLTSDPADEIQPRFSPDGQRVVFCSNRTGNWDIWLVNLDGTSLTQLTRDRADEVAPCWSPDGKRVAFSVWGKRSHQWEIWTLSVDSPGIRRYLCNGLFPAWSPDGQKLAFQRARQRGTRWFSVWTVTLVGDEARHPTELAYSDRAACIAPRWSPDGRELVYSLAPGAAAGSTAPRDAVVADVWTVDTRSGVQRRLTDGAFAAFNPSWSPNGRVYFVSARGGTENIWSVLDDATVTAQATVNPNDPAAIDEGGSSPAVNAAMGATGGGPGER